MQSLIQRRSNMGRNAMTTLDWIQHRIVWILQMLALAEVLQQLDREKAHEAEMQHIRDAANENIVSGDDAISSEAAQPPHSNSDDSGGKALTLKEAKIRSTMRCKEVHMIHIVNKYCYDRFRFSMR